MDEAFLLCETEVVKGSHVVKERSGRFPWHPAGYCDPQQQPALGRWLPPSHPNPIPPFTQLQSARVSVTSSGGACDQSHPLSWTSAGIFVCYLGAEPWPARAAGQARLLSADPLCGSCFHGSAVVAGLLSPLPWESNLLLFPDFRWAVLLVLPQGVATSSFNTISLLFLSLFIFLLLSS